MSRISLRPRPFLYTLVPALLMALALLAFAAKPAAAQDAAATPAPNAPAAAVGATSGVTATAGPDQINAVARQLWCPLCSGVRLDACELRACAQMKEVIGVKLAQGVDVQSIKNYFVAQYGPQVLGEPPMEGFNWLAWVLPVLALIAGGLFVWSRARNMVRATPNGPPGPAGPDAPAAPTASAGSAATGAAQPGGDLASKLDEELKHYD